MTRAPIDGALAEADDENGNSVDRQSLNTSHQQQASSLTSDPRSARRQLLVAHLHAAGPRPCLEALLEVAAGGNLDDVLEAYRRIPIDVYHRIGADRLPIGRLTIIKKGRAMTDARTVTRELGGRWCGSYGIAVCPAHDDKNPSLSILDGEQELIVNCFAGCDWQDVKAEFRRLGLLREETEPRRCPRTAKAPAPGTILSPKLDVDADDQERRIKIALGVWNQSVPLPNTLGWRYFTERRGLHIGLLDDLSHALRWHHGVGAVIALMTDPLTGSPTGIHRTFLNPDGTKRERKMLGHQGVIRLSPDEEVTLGLGLTEGVEDSLAVLLSGWAPVWAATSACAIERFLVPGGVESLTIFADNDPPGMKSAHACVNRWIDAGCEATILPPPDRGRP